MDIEEFKIYAEDYYQKLDKEMRGECYLFNRIIDEAIPRYHFTVKCRDKVGITYCLYLNEGVPSWSRING